MLIRTCWLCCFHSGSHVLSRAVCCLCELTSIVTVDAAPENMILLKCIQKQLQFNNSKKLFGHEGEAHQGEQDNSGSSSDGKMDITAKEISVLSSSGFSSLQEFIEWRVGLLQKIQFPIAAAFR